MGSSPRTAFPVDGPFNGPQSLRVGREWAVFAWTVIGIAIGTPVLAFVFPILNAPKEVALLLIGTMIYVTLARGRLIGGSIRVHAGQFGHVFEIAQDCARMVGMPVPAVFVRDDPFVPIVAVGIGEPYSLIISAQWVQHLTPPELRFLIGRELAHIAAGHTRITSLLSSNGRENAVVSILFGTWLRRIEYTADRAGLLCCGSLDAAISAIAVSTFHVVGRAIDLGAFAEQQREIETERSLQLGEWISSVPYATKRIAALRAFARNPLYLPWAERFERSRAADGATPPIAAAIPRKLYAGFGRRLAAFAVDVGVIAAISPRLPLGIVLSDAGSDAPAWLHRLVKDIPALGAAPTGGIGDAIFALYVVLLVGLAGQTFGMMIMDLRVVTASFGRVGVPRAMWRYACLTGSVFAVVGIVRIFGRIQPFEKWSGTRLVQGALPAALATAAVSASPFGSAASGVPVSAPASHQRSSRDDRHTPS